MLGDKVYYKLDTRGRNYAEWRSAEITRDFGDDIVDLTVLGNYADYAHPFSIGIARFNKVLHGYDPGQWITRKEYVAELTRLNREQAERREAAIEEQARHMSVRMNDEAVIKVDVVEKRK